MATYRSRQFVRFVVSGVKELERILNFFYAFLYDGVILCVDENDEFVTCVADDNAETAYGFLQDLRGGNKSFVAHKTLKFRQLKS